MQYEPVARYQRDYSLEKREITGIVSKYENDPRVSDRGGYPMKPRSREMTYRGNGNVNDVKLVQVIKKEDMG